MDRVIILEETKEDLKKLGYAQCSESKYNEYKKNTSKYLTAISDDGKYFYKEKSSGRGGGVTYPSTGLDQTKGDAFRAWMKKTNPNFKCDDGSPLSEKGKPDNTCIRKAWKDFGEKYKETLQSTTPSSTLTPPPQPTPTPNPQDGGTKTLDIKCDERWTENNYFETYFDENAEVKAKEFVKWMNSKRFYFNPGGLLFGLCGSRDIEPYVTEDLIHQSPLVKYLATKKNSFKNKEGKIIYMPSFDFWKDNVDTISKTQPATTTDTKTSTQTVSENIPAELNNLFGTGTNMLTLINRPGATKPERKACRQLIKMYDDAYFMFGDEKQPQGMTRNEFVNKMNDTKKSIFYCMKYHPGLKLDTKIERFQRISSRDWSINLLNINANKIQENNMSTIEKSLRGKLVETKMIKSLKVELHKKKLDHIAENFYKENYRKFFNQIFEHTKMLQNSNGLLTEDVSDSFQTAFNSLFLGNETKMKEQTISHILRELKVEPNSQIGVAITDELNSTPDSDVSKLLSDPTFVAGKITSAIDKSVIPQDVDDDSLESMLKSNTLNKMRSTMDDVKFKIANKLTGVLDMTRQNVEKTSTEIKQSFIDKLSSKLTDF